MAKTIKVRNDALDERERNEARLQIAAKVVTVTILFACAMLVVGFLVGFIGRQNALTEIGNAKVASHADLQRLYFKGVNERCDNSHTPIGKVIWWLASVLCMPTMPALCNLHLGFAGTTMMSIALSLGVVALIVFCVLYYTFSKKIEEVKEAEAKRTEDPIRTIAEANAKEEERALKERMAYIKEHPEAMTPDEVAQALSDLERKKKKKKKKKKQQAEENQAQQADRADWADRAEENQVQQADRAEEKQAQSEGVKVCKRRR